MSRQRLTTFVAIAVVPLLLAGAVGVREPQPWRTLVIVSEGVDQHLPDAVTAQLRALSPICPPCRVVLEAPEEPETTTLSDVDRQVLTRQLAQIPPTVAAWSGGRAALEMDVVFTDQLIDLQLMEDRGFGLGVTADSVRSLLDEEVSFGEYDSVFVAWRNSGRWGELAVRHLGLTYVTRDADTGAWFSSIKLPADLSRWSDTSLRNLFLHEWLHQVERVNMAVSNPIARLHDAADYGYTDTSAWLHDFLSGALDARLGQTTLLEPLPAH